MGRWERYDETIMKGGEAEEFNKRESEVFGKNEVCGIRVKKKNGMKVADASECI